jgi:hypothetical protein
LKQSHALLKNCQRAEVSRLLICRHRNSRGALVPQIGHNDLRANEGRETEALNCKPITNLKEISELSNYCKPAAFVCTLLVLVAHDMVHKIDEF